MATEDTTLIEAENLPAHVSACSERYRSLWKSIERTNRQVTRLWWLGLAILVSAFGGGWQGIVSTFHAMTT